MCYLEVRKFRDEKIPNESGSSLQHILLSNVNLYLGTFEQQTRKQVFIYKLHKLQSEQYLMPVEFNTTPEEQNDKLIPNTTTNQVPTKQRWQAKQWHTE